jgi:hypothetical protein
MVIIINKTVLFNGESARFSIFDLLAPAESCPQRIAIKINRVTVVRDGERSQTLCEKEKNSQQDFCCLFHSLSLTMLRLQGMLKYSFELFN